MRGSVAEKPWKSWPPELASRSAHRTQVATTRPPAARMTSPGIQADSSDARNTASGAISLTRPSRPSGVFAARTAPAPPAKVPAVTLPSVQSATHADVLFAQIRIERADVSLRVDVQLNRGIG